MLDDLKVIHDRDVQDALGIAEKEPDQLITPIIIQQLRNFDQYTKIVYCGMGGSALAALLLHTWPALMVPFEVVRDYDIPAYVRSDTLCIVASYSGNTEEALSCIAQAEATGATIVVIAGGGKLQSIAEDKGYMLALLPKVSQPRFAVFANYRALLQILSLTGILQGAVWEQEVTRLAERLREAVATWVPTVATARNPAKKIALEVIGKSIVIYGGPKLAPAAYKWKISFNENAKHIAWWNQYSEFNHNEFIGWSKQPVDKPYAVIELRSALEHPRIQKRFAVSERLLSGRRPSPIVVAPVGDTIIEQLCWAVLLGDFVSLYTAILNGINPTPVALIERLKSDLDA